MSRGKRTISGSIRDAGDKVLSLVSKRDPRKSQKYQGFTEDVMRVMLSGFERNKNPSDPKQAEIINKWKARLESKEFLDDIMCNEMIGELTKFIDDKEVAKKYQDAAKASVAAVQKGIEENVPQGDEVWKWQMLQLFAIMTPLGAFSIAGHVFNYLNPLMDLFGPVFGNAGIAQGVADVATSSQLGPFGKLARMMKIDKGIEAVLTKTPILKDLIEIADLVTTNENVQLMGAELCPLLTASEMPLLAIAGSAVIMNLGDDLDHQKKKNALSENETIGKLIKTMPKNKVKAPNPPEVKPAVVAGQPSKTVVQPPETPAKKDSAIIQQDKKCKSEMSSPSSSPQKSPAQKTIDYTQLISEPRKMIDTTDRRGGGITVGGK